MASVTRFPAAASTVSYGTVDWANLSQIYTSDGVSAAASLGHDHNVTGTIYFTGVKLIKGGTIGGTAHGAGAAFTNRVLGTTTDLWGQTLSDTDVNGTTFGIAVAALASGCTGTGASNETSYHLKASNFGFSIPSGATINGIEATFVCSWGNGGSWNIYAWLDSVSLTIYYTAAVGPALLKTVNGLAVASVKTLRSGLAIASGKTFNGLA
jgi:hypothetical protein